MSSHRISKVPWALMSTWQIGEEACRIVWEVWTLPAGTVQRSLAHLPTCLYGNSYRRQGGWENVAEAALGTGSGSLNSAFGDSRPVCGVSTQPGRW